MYLTTAAAILLLTHAAYGQSPRCARNPDITGAVVIPAGWTEIPEMAFFSCEALTSIVIPNTITIINDDAFRLTNLVKVEFENGSRLHTIGSSAFMSTIHMKRIKIPRSVTLIKRTAFYGAGVEDFQFEKDSQLHTIGIRAFKVMFFLKKIKIPKSVKLIESEAFSQSRIEEVEFENGSQLKEIRSKAFESTQLVTINIPAGVRVGADVFEDTPCLKKSIFKPGVKIVKCKEVRSTFSSKTTKISSSPPSEVTSSPTMHETSPRAVISVRGSTKAKKSTKFKKGKNATKKNKAKKIID